LLCWSHILVKSLSTPKVSHKNCFLYFIGLGHKINGEVLSFTEINDLENAMGKVHDFVMKFELCSDLLKFHLNLTT